MRYVTVRVVDSGGRPQRDTRVSLWIGGYIVGGSAGEKYTNSEGEAEFKLDYDSGEVTVYVNGQEKLRDSIRSEYKVTI